MGGGAEAWCRAVQGEEGSGVPHVLPRVLEDPRKGLCRPSLANHPPCPLVGGLAAPSICLR